MKLPWVGSVACCTFSWLAWSKLMRLFSGFLLCLFLCVFLFCIFDLDAGGFLINIFFLLWKFLIAVTLFGAGSGGGRIGGFFFWDLKCCEWRSSVLGSSWWSSVTNYCAILGFKYFWECAQWNAAVEIPISRFSSRSDAIVVLNSWLYMPWLPNGRTSYVSFLNVWRFI